MIAENTTFFDGHWYEKGEEIPDIGSFVASPDSDKIRNYTGLSKDIDKLTTASKLPKYDDLETGSSAFTVDTAQLLNYEKTTRTWYEL